MKAIVLQEIGDIVLQEFDPPRIEDSGDAIVARNHFRNLWF